MSLIKDRVKFSAAEDKSFTAVLGGRAKGGGRRKGLEGEGRKGKAGRQHPANQMCSGFPTNPPPAPHLPDQKFLPQALRPL